MAIILIILGLFLVYKIIIEPTIIREKLKLDSFTLVTGGVKTGKSTLAVYLAVNEFYKIRFKVKFKNLLKRVQIKLGRKNVELEELPVIYSNIPLKTKYGYSPLTKEILLREKNPIEKSVIYIDEFTLVADSMDWKDDKVNERMVLFFKLFGHQFDGKIFCSTHNISDCHYSVKKVATKYIWIYRSYKGLFNYHEQIREIYYSYEDNSVVSTINKDIESTTNEIYVPYSIWRLFNYRAFKWLTKNNETERNNIDKRDILDLYAKELVSFKKWKTMSVYGKNNNKELTDNGKQTK